MKIGQIFFFKENTRFFIEVCQRVCIGRFNLIWRERILEIFFPDVVGSIVRRDDDVGNNAVDLRALTGHGVVTANGHLKENIGLRIGDSLILNRSLAKSSLIANYNRNAVVLERLSDDFRSGSGHF